ncbi:MAG: indolepyruvate oxidoreductase subunit beta [Burkholderiales bacterium]
MNYDLVICGVGGQGVLSIAWAIDHAAFAAGFHLKQPEVHGMAQRGGAVSALVRISDAPIASDLIPEGTARMVLSVEPMEALRYAAMLDPDGWIVTDVSPLKNVAAYPDTGKLFDVLFSLPRVIAVDAGRLAHKAGTIKAHNMVMLGAAAALLPLPAGLVERQLPELFADKGARIVAANVDAFRMGDAAGRFTTALIDAGIAAGVAARVAARLDFAAAPVDEDVVATWIRRLRAAEAPATARRVFASDRTVPLDLPAVTLAG